VNRPSYDVVIATDCRLPGGTTASVAEEIVAQHRAGLTTGLLHIPSRLSAAPRPFAPRLRELVQSRACEVVLGDHVACRLLLVRHPAVAEAIASAALPRVSAEQVLLIANQAAGSPDGRVAHYDPARATQNLEAWSGLPVRWVPIGPLVRNDLTGQAEPVALAATDWVNVIDVVRWETHRDGPRSPVRIGRHSRDHALKWPADRETLLQVYPDAPDVDVRILGGAEIPRQILGGGLPSNWRVLPFGAMPVRRFLEGIDLFVYYHHPAWVEAFGRTIIEAMATGAVAVLPPHFEPVFGPAAVYATPAAALDRVRALASSPDDYAERSDLGRTSVAERFSHAAHLERLADLGLDVRPQRTIAAERPSPLRRHRVLFMSSNGAGVGHLMRLMAIARRLPDGIEPTFLTLSQAIGPVRELGFTVEYLPSRGALDAPHRAWHQLLEHRLVGLIDELDIRAVVFDGTWPYDGLLSALDQRPDVQAVWSRRAMWRRDVVRHQLHLSPRFDLIVEPGEEAAEHDRGATVARRSEARHVGPVTFLRRSELLPRAAARDALGLPTNARTVLVHLGAGNINDTSELLGTVTAALRDADDELEIVVTRSAIAVETVVPEKVHPISVYPLARYLQAFDLVIAASGYNTFHEVLTAEVPAIFVPNQETATDDQAARANWAERQGLGRCVADPTPEAITEAIVDMLAPTAPSRVMASYESLGQRPDGGQQIAELLAGLVEGSRLPAGTGTSPGGPAAPRSFRTRLRVAAAKLPPPLQRPLRRIWRQLRGGSGASPTGRIPVPTGAGWDPSTSARTRGVLVITTDLEGADATRRLVARVAELQRSIGGFAPLFVTSDVDLAPFRERGYAAELLPQHVVEGGDGTRTVALRRARRLVELTRHYDISAIVTVDDAERLDELLEAVASVA
jgi:UDP:flavonoid glycosyltransferase YjiC (YdhE family)